MCVENERESKGETICEGDTHKHTQTYIGRECVQKRERELVSVLLSDVIGTSMTERERERERERENVLQADVVSVHYLPTT